MCRVWFVASIQRGVSGVEEPFRFGADNLNAVAANPLIDPDLLPTSAPKEVLDHARAGFRPRDNYYRELEYRTLNVLSYNSRFGIQHHSGRGPVP